MEPDTTHTMSVRVLIKGKGRTYLYYIKGGYRADVWLETVLLFTLTDCSLSLSVLLYPVEDVPHPLKVL